MAGFTRSFHIKGVLYREGHNGKSKRTIFNRCGANSGLYDLSSGFGRATMDPFFNSGMSCE